MAEIENQPISQVLRKYFSIVFLSFAIGLLVPESIKEVQAELDQVYVVINDEVITKTEVDDQLRNAIYKLRSRGEIVPSSEQLERDVVEMLVDLRLQYQRARELGISVSVDQVLIAIRGIAEKNGLSMLELRKEVTNTGRSYEEYQAELRQQLLVKKLVEREVTQKIDISEEEIADHLATHQEGVADIAYNLSHVLIGSQDDRDGAQDLADQIYEKIVGGSSFYRAVSAVQSQVNNVSTSHLGWLGSDRLPDLFIAIVEQLEVGKITRPIESQNGFHILRLNGKRGDNLYIIDQVRISHILMVSNEFRDEATTEKELLVLRERIKSDAQFNEIARLYSEDLDSRALGGDLGWVDPDELLPELASLAIKSDIGEVSMPIKTSRGYHIIQVVNRRSKDISDQIRRKSAEQEIRLSKFNDQYRSWIDALRDAAWIDYRISHNTKKYEKK